jgi:beta-glucanase (GH16 family)
MENVGDPTWTNVALHGPGYSGNTPLGKRRMFPAGTDITDWHIYSMEWTHDGFVFKIDDQEFYRVDRAMVEHYGRWAYDTPKYLIVNFALGGNYPHGVNKTDAPYPGLPQSTVDLIKAGKARMLVDWIKVAKN